MRKVVFIEDIKLIPLQYERRDYISSLNFTIGNVYIITPIVLTNGIVLEYIQDDFGKEYEFPIVKNKFISIADYRNLKINRILNDKN